MRTLQQQHTNAQQICLDGIADEQAKQENDPRQVRGREWNDAEEGHPNVRILRPTRPHIHHHEGERVAQELDPGEGVEAVGTCDHSKGTEQQHEHKICCAIPEGTFFQ